ncbi:septin 7, isoform CRA_a [Absidia repens]|uniref:Septin 7, isoform CRA_a n=1 Tax=Absidia repens TaxID=90262 RepID=A0A1X2IDK6_9FUNG|nr:septin 7, isoform CRA_a [Absidia repens]
MTVGESGLGKSTFLNTLFQTDICEATIPLIEHTGVTIQSITCALEEDGVRMLLTVTDTPGFGDRCDRTNDLKPILQYIDDQYSAYFEIESGMEKRQPSNQHDTRVHLCFYFIAPHGHHLKELDIVALQALSSHVSVIPLIAKADTLTHQERAAFKEKVSMDLKENNIRVYPSDYPDKNRSDLPSECALPFCVIGSSDMMMVDGKQVRGREYSWGTVHVENPAHSDFFTLRSMLMDHLLHELGDVTHNVHYSSYRTKRLRKELRQSRPDSLLPCDDDYDARLTTLRSDLLSEMASKEDKITQEYLEKVKAAETRLYSWEQELTRKKLQLDEELHHQHSLLEQTRLMLDQEDNYNNQWKIKSKHNHH